jgi:hypothetical protein
MRSVLISVLVPVLVLGLLVTLCASANAAKVHRAKPPQGHLRPAQRDTLPKGFAVPGWTDEETRQWLSYPRVSG